MGKPSQESGRVDQEETQREKDRLEVAFPIIVPQTSSVLGLTSYTSQEAAFYLQIKPRHNELLPVFVLCTRLTVQSY